MAELAELGASLVDLHGQHAHQSLLAPAAQRGSLDRFAGIDPGPVNAATAEVRRLEAELAQYGGDDAARARELEFCRFQLAEMEAAELDDPDEDAALEAEEELLADAVAHQEAAASAYDALSADGGAGDAMATAVGLVRDRAPLAGVEGRVRALAADLTDVAAELRELAETLEPDPERLEWIRSRRSQLRELARKYGVAGTGPLAGSIIDYSAGVRDRLLELEHHEQRAGSIEVRAGGGPGSAGGRAGPGGQGPAQGGAELGAATQTQLNALAMPRARLGVSADRPSGSSGSTSDAVDPGDDVLFLLAANPGAPLLPLAKVASGGELARAMLALRLALLRAGDPQAGLPPTMIFDEVDAGIGGSAASAVGEALAQIVAVDGRSSSSPTCPRSPHGPTIRSRSRRRRARRRRCRSCGGFPISNGSPSWPGCCRARPIRRPPKPTPLNCSPARPPPVPAGSEAARIRALSAPGDALRWRGRRGG